VGDLCVSQLQEQLLWSLESEAGTEVGDVLGVGFSAGAVAGLAMDLRKSM
jgi:hypothetical protein